MHLLLLTLIEQVVIVSLFFNATIILNKALIDYHNFHIHTD